MVLGIIGFGGSGMALLYWIIGLVISLRVAWRQQMVSCVKCSTLTERVGFSLGQMLCCFFFFPIGLLALLGGRDPTVCGKCGHIWTT